MSLIKFPQAKLLLVPSKTKSILRENNHIIQTKKETKRTREDEVREISMNVNLSK